jgi:hypothetical protein
MPMDAHDIESMIKAAIPDAEVTIRDLATATECRDRDLGVVPRKSVSGTESSISR